MKNWLQNKNTLSLFYEAEKDEYKNIIREKYCQGSISKWEMDSVSFYASGHELDNINFADYRVVNFFNLSEEPEIVSSRISANGNTVYQYKLSRIAGTVVNVNRQKHIVSLLTTNGVVDVKFFKLNFIHYNKKISKDNGRGAKFVIENSWFTRGNKLMIEGYRKDNNFIPKSSSWQVPAVFLIEKIIGNKIQIKKFREKEN